MAPNNERRIVGEQWLARKIATNTDNNEKKRPEETGSGGRHPLQPFFDYLYSQPEQSLSPMP